MPDLRCVSCGRSRLATGDPCSADQPCRLEPLQQTTDNSPRRSQTRLYLDPDHFARRVLQDCLTQATAQHWLNRAAAFEWASPRPDDFVGAATPAQLAEAATRCRESAEACRRRSKLILSGAPEEISAAVDAAWQEVA